MGTEVPPSPKTNYTRCITPKRVIRERSNMIWRFRGEVAQTIRVPSHGGKGVW